MKVLFKKDVKDVASAGQVKEVSDGYARNFLIPRGLAVPATAGAIKQASDQEAVLKRRAAQEEEEARKLQARLEARPIVVRAKAGSGGRLYGSVTSADIAAALKQQLAVEVERRDLEVPDTIRTVGEHTVKAKLQRAVTATLTLDVQAEASS